MSGGQSPLVAGAVGLFALPLVLIAPFVIAAETSAVVTCLPQAAPETGTFHGDGTIAETVDSTDLAPFTGKPLGAALAALPAAKNSERRLKGNTVLTLRLIEKLWPYYGNKGGGSIGGWREDAIADHPSGQALDIMLKDDGRTKASVAAGNEVAAFLVANSKALGVDYMMFRHRIWGWGSETSWRQAKEYGSWVDNHMNHIHLKMFGDHVPSGKLKLPAGREPIAAPAAATRAAGPKAAVVTPRTISRQAAAKKTPAPAASNGAEPTAQTGDADVVWPVGKGAYGGVHPTGARDMGRALGRPVVAAHGGKVIESRDTPPEIPLPEGKYNSGGYGSYGRTITVAWKNADGDWMGNLYGHLRTRSAQVGEEVKAGQLIGYVGSTGNSSGPHLHFEYFTTGTSPRGGKTGFDPLPWLQTGVEPQLDNLPEDPTGTVTGEECKTAGGISEELPAFGAAGPYTDSATPVQTHGTFYSGVEAARRLVKWANEGRSGYAHKCLQLADDAYSPKGDRVDSAIAQWYRVKAAGVAHPKDKTPPVGAHLFWWTPNSARHIATYVGGGKVVTNVTGKGGAVEIMDAQELDSWGPYLGWAAPYY